MSFNCSKRIAFKDITEYIRCNGIQVMDGRKDVWVVTPVTLDCKEQRKLNRDLKINIVNYFGNQNRK